MFLQPDKIQPIFMTGGDDGFLRLWDQNLGRLCQFDLRSHSSYLGRELNLAITSVSNQDSEFAIGTRSGEIYFAILDDELMSLDEEMQIIQSHCEEKVTGAVVSHVQQELFTVGSNSIIMKWDLVEKRLILFKKTNFPASVMDVSINNNFLAVGCTNGTLLVLNPDTLEDITSANIEHKEITAVTFSTSNETLAIGHAHGVIHILNIPMNFKVMFTFQTKDICPVIAIDYSEDNLRIRVMLSNKRLSYHSLSRKVKVVKEDSEELIQEKWYHWRSSLGWQIVGIWSEYDNISEIKGVARNFDKDIIAVWDIYGTVKVYKFPCYNPNSPFYKLTYNSGPIASVVFSADSQLMLIIGERDSAIIQFSINSLYIGSLDKMIRFQEQSPSPLEEAPRDLPKNTFNQPVEYLTNLPSLWPKEAGHSITNRDFDWINMEVELAAGLSQRGVQNPVLAINDHTIIYNCGTTLVAQKLTEPRGEAERSYSHLHTKKIGAMDLSPKRDHLASGERAERPDDEAHVIVLEILRNEIITKYRLNAGESCSLLKFPPESSYLLIATTKESMTRLLILDWINSSLVSCTAVGEVSISSVAFEGEYTFTSVGRNHVSFWNNHGCHLSGVGGDFDIHEPQELTVCEYAFKQNILFTGSTAGMISRWRGSAMSETFHRHKGAITMIKRYEGETLFTCGEEGIIFRWGYSSDLNKEVEVFDLQDKYRVPTAYLGIFPFFHEIIAVSQRGDAMVLANKAKTGVNFQEITSQIMCACFDDKQDQCIICTADFKIVVQTISTVKYERTEFSFEKHNVFYTAITPLKGDVEGKFLLASSKGKLIIANSQFETENSIDTLLAQDSNHITIIKQSPCLKYVAVCSNAQEGRIELFTLKQSPYVLFKDFVVIPSIAGAIIAFDWDQTSDYILLNSNKNEMTCIDVATKKSVDVRAMRGSKQDTYTTVFNYFSSGLHPLTNGKTDISAVCTKSGLPFVVAGTKRGEVLDVSPRYSLRRTLASSTRSGRK
jgi:WD40 repeat protein